ncbi:MAG: CPBP family intramembrane glutamic endopeptidase [Leptospirales bacterium]|jgi:membrane protease YdiL (CAAX protease family)
MRRFIHSFQFFVLTLAISAPFFLLAAAVPAFGRPESPGALAVWLGMIWSPNLAAACLAWRGCEAGLAAFVRRRFHLGFTAPVVGMALAPFLVFIVCWCVVQFFALTPSAPSGESVALPTWQILTILPALHFIMGPLGEEAGWRGYLLPRLIETTTPARAAFVVGCAWAVWHLPLWLLEGAPQRMIPIPVFCAHVLCYSIWMTWLHTRSSGSIVPAIVFHWAVNYGAAVFTIYTGFDAGEVYSFTIPGYVLLAGVALRALRSEPG